VGAPNRHDEDRVTTQVYPAILVKDAGAPADAPIGVVFPDLPGCNGQGYDARHASVMALEALATHAEALVADGEDLPEPSAPGLIPDWLDPAESEVIAHVLVPLELPGRSVRVNITIDEGLLQRVDRAAASHGFTRSGLLAEAVRTWLRRDREPPRRRRSA
jgi:predicted RNase H-like HicB family nuclease